MRWLVASLAVSIVLTVVLNIGLRAFPDAGDRAARALAELASPNGDHDPEHDRRLRVFVPWKAMIVGSVILTIVVNLAWRFI